MRPRFTLHTGRSKHSCARLTHDARARAAKGSPVTATDAMWVAIRVARESGECVRVVVPIRDDDGTSRDDDLGACRVLHYDYRSTGPYQVEVATVQPDAGGTIRVVHRITEGLGQLKRDVEPTRGRRG